MSEPSTYRAAMNRIEVLEDRIRTLEAALRHIAQGCDDGINMYGWDTISITWARDIARAALSAETHKFDEVTEIPGQKSHTDAGN